MAIPSGSPPEGRSLSRSTTPTIAATRPIPSAAKYGHDSTSTATFDRNHTSTSASRIENDHRYRSDGAAADHRHVRTATNATHAVPRHQPPMVIVTKSDTDQANRSD